MSDISVNSSKINVNQPTDNDELLKKVVTEPNPADIGAVEQLDKSVSSVINDPAINPEVVNKSEDNSLVDKANEISKEITVSDLTENSHEIMVKKQNPIDDDVKALIGQTDSLVQTFETSKSLEQILKLKESVSLMQDKISDFISDVANKITVSASEEKEEVILAALFQKYDAITSISDSLESLENLANDLKEINSDTKTTKLQKLENLKELYDNEKKSSPLAQSEYKVRLDMIAQSANMNLGLVDVAEKFVSDLTESNIYSTIGSNQYDTISNLTNLLSSLYLDYNGSEKEEKIFSPKNLFGHFKESNASLYKGYTDKELKIEFIKQINALFLSTDAKDICSRIDKLFFKAQPSIALSLKEVFTSPNEYNVVIATHTYKHALLNIVKSFPKDLQKKFEGKTYFDREMFDALKANDKLFKSHNYELVHLLALQHRLVDCDLIDVVSSDFDKHKDEILAVELCMDIAGDELVTQVFNDLVKGKNGNFSVSNTEIIAAILTRVQDLADKYEIQNLSGDKTSSDYLKQIKKTANILANGVASNTNVRQVYDTVHEVKTLRVFDNVFMNFTGELDVDKRGILTGDESLENLKNEGFGPKTELQSKIQKGLDNGLRWHSRYLKKPSEEGFALMKSFLTSDSNNVNDVIKSFSDDIDEKIDINSFRKDQATEKLNGLREKFIEFYNTLENYEKNNDKSIELHTDKKKLNKSYKEKKAIYDSIKVAWPWDISKRKENIDLIKELEFSYDRLTEFENLRESINNGRYATVEEIEEINGHIEYYSSLINEIFPKVKDLDLTKLYENKKDIDPNDTQTVKEFLDKAKPIADAFIYFKGKGDGSDPECKVDSKKIKALKKERNKYRSSLNDNLKLAKKAFGTETVTQLQRAIMLSVYIASKENPENNANAYSPDSRKNIEKILSERMGLDATKGFLHALVSDTIRRYTDPNGNITEKYLSLIESKFCKESLVVSDKKYFDDPERIKALESKTIQRYKQVGSKALLSYVDAPGKSFTYSRQLGVKVAATIAFAQLSARNANDDSIAVSNTGKGYEVFLNHKNTTQLAAKYTFLRLRHEATVEAGISANYSHIKGLKLNFKTQDELDAFLKDFMDNSSELHTNNDYTPKWMEKCTFATVTGNELGGEAYISANIALNSLSKVTKSYGRKSAVYGIPDFKAKVGAGIVHNSATTKKGALRLTSSRTQYHISAEASVDMPTVKIKNTKFYDGFTKLAIDNIGLPLVLKHFDSLKPFIGPLFNTLKDTVSSKNGRAFLDDVKKNLIQDMDKNPGASLSDIMRQSIGDAFTKHKTKLLMEITHNYASQKTDSTAVKATQFTASMYFNYLALQKGFNPFASAGYNPIAYNASIKFDIASNAKNAFTAISQYLGSNPKDPNENVGAIADFVAGIKNFAKGTVAVLTPVLKTGFGDPIGAISSICSMVGEKQIVDYKSQYGEVHASAGGDKILSVGASGRSTNVEGGASLNLKEGFKAKLTLFSIVDTVNTIAFDDDTERYTADTSLKQSVPKSNMSLENSLRVLDLPDSLLEKIVGNKEVFNKLKEAYANAEATDSVVVNYKIKPEALKTINEKQNKLKLERGTVNEFFIKQEIRKLLSDKNNYEPVSLSIDVSKEQRLYTPVDIFANLDLGVIALDHARKFKNCESHIFDLKSLKETVVQIDNTKNVNNENNEISEDDDFELVIDEMDPEELSKSSYFDANDSSDSQLVNPSVNNGSNSQQDEIIDTTVPSGSANANNVSDVKSSEVKESAQKITYDIKQNQFFKQTPGMRTCFIMSVLNSLTQTEKGVEHLKNYFTENGFLYDGNYYSFFKDSGAYTPIEKTLVDLYRKEDSGYSLEKGGYPDGFGENILNLETTMQCADVGLDKTLSFDDLYAAFNGAQKSDVVIFSKKAERHHIAIIGAVKEGDNSYVFIKDSSGDESNSGITKIPFDDLPKKDYLVTFMNIKK